MFRFSKKDINSFKITGLLFFVILAVLILTFGVKSYFTGKISEDWASISAEKNSQIHNECILLYNDYQNQTAEFSSSLSKNKKIVSSFIAGNTRKTYEAVYALEGIGSYNIELYNSRLELFLFSGRQIHPDVLELMRALSGERFSTVKDVGFYTYIVVFEPVKNENGVPEGVLAVSRLLDVDQRVQNKFFPSLGIRKQIYDIHHIDVFFDFSKSSLAPAYDTSSGELAVVQVNNINNENTGKLIIPNLDQSSYILNVSNKFDNIISILVFALNVLAIYLLSLVSARTQSLPVKIIIIVSVLAASRYLWLLLGLPSRIFAETGSDIFSPIHFASGFGFGVAKSIGELLISSFILLVIIIYVSVIIISYYRREKEDTGSHNLYISYLKNAGGIVLALIASVYSLHLYGLIIQSLIYNSTIRFIDKSDIFSLSQPELIIARLIITVFSVALFLIQVCSGLVIIRNTNQYFSRVKFLRKNSSLFIFGIIILLNLIISAFPESFIDISLKFSLRLVILMLAGVFTFYLMRQISVKREFSFINVVNFSFILLACVIFVPAVLLNKITAQENRYLERAAKEISRQSNDKIGFLISSTLDDITDDIYLENNINNRNKQSSLAFTLWSSSKFYDEELNSAIFVLDTAKKLISDFNINPGELNSDSVVSFTLRNFKNVIPEDSLIAEEEVVGNEEDPENNEPSDINNVNRQFREMQSQNIMQNREMRFYSSIRPVERTMIRNGSILGYVIVSAGYDAKNFLTKTNLGIFRNFARDNILSKLTSMPVMSEFTDGELVGSSNKEVSRSFLKSLDAFRESVKDKIDKSSLRYDEFENEIYKSFYVLGRNQQGPGEKIYIVSIKINDFGLSTFYFFRYLLFVVLIYIGGLILYILYKLLLFISNPSMYRFFRFGFREKLFASFLLASVIPIVILAVYTREFVKDKNESFYSDQLISDLRIVEQYVKSRIFSPSYKPLDASKYPVKQSDLFVSGFSESDKNFNLYVKNKLSASTSEQLYKSDLLDSRISGNAFYNIALLKRDYFPENQQIEDFTFRVGYKPVYDKYSNLTGIISTQTVFKQNEINQELTESLVYILGPYFTAVIILIFLVNFLSYRISNPVLKLQKATEQLSRGNIDVQVKSNSKDEIGELVTSFNRMIRELKRSRAELKKAEREGAWRDIARQVAHEIKNPLTPMKLAMQHLYKSYTMGSPEFKSIIKTTNKLIIDQIETLNKIATEFSNFAKLPSRNYELLDLNDILNDVVKLMNTKGEIHFKAKESAKKLVMGDKDELRRALINIIKNSIQAVEEREDNKKPGLINIETLNNNGYFVVRIKDNGIGMDEQTRHKLFEPYFSTKSSGMGLGLVITKKILDDMKAKITVKSNEGKGTEVEISFKTEI